MSPAAPPTLATGLPGLRLRPWAVADREALVAEADDRAVWRNLFHTFPHPYTAADAEGWIALTAQAAPSLHLCIELDGRVAGGIGIQVGEGTEQMTGRFGYWLGRRHWGHGRASAAGAAMVDHARRHMGLVRLEAPVFAWNPASMRVLEKLGFVREGVLRKSVCKDGQLTDSVMFALLLDEPRTLPSPPARAPEAPVPRLTVDLATPGDRLPLQRMLELYQHDLSDIWPQDLDAHGDYGYDLDRFIARADAWAHIARVDGRFAGFALVDRRVRVPGDDFWMDQFFVLRGHRRHAVGGRLAAAVFDAHPGRWQVGQMPANLPAQAFWRRVIGAYTGGGYREQTLVSGRWQGVLQSFVAPGRA